VESGEGINCLELHDCREKKKSCYSRYRVNSSIPHPLGKNTPCRFPEGLGIYGIRPKKKWLQRELGLCLKKWYIAHFRTQFLGLLTDA